MAKSEEIRRDISYWIGFRDALEIALLKPEKIGMLHSRAIVKLGDMRKSLMECEAHELIESQSRPPEILQDKGGRDTPEKEVI